MHIKLLEKINICFFVKINEKKIITVNKETREKGGGRPDVQGTRSQGYAHTQTQTYKRHKLARTALTSVCRLYV